MYDNILEVWNNISNYLVPTGMKSWKDCAQTMATIIIIDMAATDTGIDKKNGNTHTVQKNATSNQSSNRQSLSWMAVIRWWHVTEIR